MQKYMTKKQFINFKQWQWCYIFWFSVILIFNVEIKTAIACGLVGAYSLLKTVRWGLFNS